MKNDLETLEKWEGWRCLQTPRWISTLVYIYATVKLVPLFPEKSFVQPCGESYYILVQRSCKVSFLVSHENESAGDLCAGGPALRNDRQSLGRQKETGRHCSLKKSLALGSYKGFVQPWPVTVLAYFWFQVNQRTIGPTRTETSAGPTVAWPPDLPSSNFAITSALGECPGAPAADDLSELWVWPLLAHSLAVDYWAKSRTRIVGWGAL